MKQVRMRSVVDLPAPLGPRKPTISPFPTLNDRSSTAVTPGYVLVRLLTSIMRQYQRRTRREVVDRKLLTGVVSIAVTPKGVKGPGAGRDQRNSNSWTTPSWSKVTSRK